MEAQETLRAPECWHEACDHPLAQPSVLQVQMLQALVVPDERGERGDNERLLVAALQRIWLALALLAARRQSLRHFSPRLLFFALHCEVAFALLVVEG